MHGCNVRINNKKGRTNAASRHEGKSKTTHFTSFGETTRTSPRTKRVENTETYRKLKKR